jgi:hypothetical protein
MTGSTLDPTQLKRSDRTALQILSGIAIVIAAASLLAGIAATVMRAADLGLPFELLTSVARELDDPRVVWAEYSETQLVTTGIGGWGRALLAIGLAISTVMVVTTAAASAYFLRRLAAGEPFDRRFSRLAYFVGGVLALGGIVAGAATGIGSMVTAAELNETTPHAFGVGFTFDWTPVLAGLAVMALGFVFRAGARLQRDTEGLV